ncbi:expressed unknown protein [Seminavis robusta]|uniref:Uncharacterized protein n=1 Tax=Seminavis robusta TaxID=568900 RepID=A0A9N8HB54_9STRA|nr:expressed unknown protein [Seminavis robusta]|eukprot:Sro323_g117331.1  (226) ;mRNA; r:39669-40346
MASTMKHRSRYHQLLPLLLLCLGIAQTTQGCVETISAWDNCLQSLDGDIDRRCLWRCSSLPPVLPDLPVVPSVPCPRFANCVGNSTSAFPSASPSVSSAPSASPSSLPSSAPSASPTVRGLCNEYSLQVCCIAICDQCDCHAQAVAHRDCIAGLPSEQYNEIMTQAGFDGCTGVPEACNNNSNQATAHTCTTGAGTQTNDSASIFVSLLVSSSTVLATTVAFLYL